MYQGTFYNSLKVFNRTSRIGRKTLTSRIRPFVKVIALTVWITLIAAAVVSFLDQEGIIDFTIMGVDTTVFLYSLYFNFLWYLVFIAPRFLVHMLVQRRDGVPGAPSIKFPVE